MAHLVDIGAFSVGQGQRPFLIAGPCVIENEQLVLETAGRIAEITRSLGIPYVFKSSFDKANRTSISSFRGPGLAEGLEVLAKVKRQVGVPVLTDVHTEEQAAEAGPGAREGFDHAAEREFPAFRGLQLERVAAAHFPGKRVQRIFPERRCKFITHGVPLSRGDVKRHWRMPR